MPFRQHGQFSHHTPLANELLLPLELLSLYLSPVYYGFGIPRGDGSAVILIPGLAGLDEYMLPMYLWLADIGYRPYFSGIGLLADCPQRLSGRLHQTILKAYGQTGRRRVHLIGHSLGGIFARSAAVLWPKLIASVISLGSPFRGLVANEAIFTISDLVRQWVHTNDPALPANCGTSRCACAFGRSLIGHWPMSVFQTAIASPNDGLVDWRHCLTGRPDVDVKVWATHLGMPFDAGVYVQLARRLAVSRGISPRLPKPKPR